MTTATLNSNYDLGNGLQVLLQYVNDISSGLFINVLLFMVFVIVLVNIYVFTEKRTGKGDFTQAFAVAMFITTLIAGILSLIPGLVNPDVLVMLLVVSTLALLALMFFNE